MVLILGYQKAYMLVWCFGFWCFGMTPNEKGLSENGGATAKSQSAPLTRVFVSKKYGFKVEKREDGFYVLSGEHGYYETRDFDVMLELVELNTSKRTAQLLSKRLRGE